MSVEDRLLKLEEIWNSFDKEALKSPKWHEEILKKRKEKFKNNEMEFISIYGLKNENPKMIFHGGQNDKKFVSPLFH